MSDAFFEKLFGDSEPGDFGTGWISGTASVFFGLLGFGGALCLHFPGLLSLPDARAVYPMTIIRALIQGTIVLAIVLGAISGLLRERKVLAVTGASLGLLAAIIGGGSTPLPDEVHIEIRSRSGLVSAGSVRDDRGLPAGGTILAAASGSEDVSASMDHGPVLLRGHAPARAADDAGDGRAGRLCVQVAGDSMAGQHRREPAVSHPAAAGDCRRRSLAIRHSSRLSPHSIPVALSCDPSLH